MIVKSDKVPVGIELSDEQFRILTKMAKEKKQTLDEFIDDYLKKYMEDYLKEHKGNLKE